MKKIAVVLFNLGGPTDLRSVRPFLFNLFKDKAIINLPFFLRYPLAAFIAWKRNKTAQRIYKKLGGKSPLLEITNMQAEALEKELSFETDNYKVFVSMRYWHPMSEEVVKHIKDYSPDQIIMLPLYPQFSTTTTASSFNDFTAQIEKQEINAKLKYICCYPNNQQFIFSHLRLIKKAIKEVEHKKHKKYRLLFSAHGLPQSVVDQGDPYVEQINATADLIIKELEKNLKISSNAKSRIAKSRIDYKVCYQSKVGPTRWTGPSLDVEIARAGVDKKAVILIPIAFVSDHSETLVELDIEYKRMAKEKKVPLYLRVPALNDDGYFVKALLDICKEAVKSDYNILACNNTNKAFKCCPNKFKKCFAQSGGSIHIIGLEALYIFILNN